MSEPITFELLWSLVIEMQSIPLIALIGGLAGWLNRLPKELKYYKTLKRGMITLDVFMSIFLRPQLFAFGAAILASENGFSPAMVVVATVYASFDSERMMNLITAFFKVRLGITDTKDSSKKPP